MAFKKVDVEGLGTVHLYKRRGAKSLRLSITHTGAIRVSLPMWVPYKLGIDFAIKKREWLLEKHKTPKPLNNGQRIGKAHHLAFIAETGRSRITSRINHGEIKILFPVEMMITHPNVQKAAFVGSIRGLKLEATALLPQRLDTLARQHGFSYKSVTIKRLTSRWGSCSQDHNIVLNCYLMQLPWELIDYVLLHELMHTQIMAHGKPFWSALSQYVPNLTAIRKTMRQHQPAFIPSLA